MSKDYTVKITVKGKDIDTYLAKAKQYGARNATRSDVLKSLDDYFNDGVMFDNEGPIVGYSVLADLGVCDTRNPYYNKAFGS